jgi:hypothetical protein
MKSKIHVSLEIEDLKKEGVFENILAGKGGVDWLVETN